MTWHHLEGAERTVEAPKLLDGLSLDRAPLRRYAALVLRTRVPNHFARETEMLAHATDCSHLRRKKVGKATRVG